MLTGWIDASGAAAAAMATVQEEWSVRPLATFDGDTFIDYRARRPTMELREGVNVRLVWADIELHVGRDADGHDVLTLSGPEPDSQWRRFADVRVDAGGRARVSSRWSRSAPTRSPRRTRATLGCRAARRPPMSWPACRT